MNETRLKSVRHKRRKRRVRKAVFGTADRPRLTVFRSLKHIYAQIIDDERGVTVCSAGTRAKDLRDSVGYGGNATAAAVVGKALGEKAKAAGVSKVCFDRNGRKYHGRLKALADAAREAGLEL